MLTIGIRRYFVIFTSIATVLFVYFIISHVLVCVRHIQTLVQINPNVLGYHNYNVYVETGTMSSLSFSNLRSADMFRNQGHNLTNQTDILTSIYNQSMMILRQN